MRHQLRQEIFLRGVLCILTVILCWHFSAAIGRADDLVTCQYQQAEGRRISLRLEIGSPVPSMLILVQKIPANRTITKAIPPVKKYNRRKGEAKWLLKDLQQGTKLFTIDLDGEVAANQINGEIRYKNPSGGKMIVMKIRP